MSYSDIVMEYDGFNYIKHMVSLITVGILMNSGECCARNNIDLLNFEIFQGRFCYSINTRALIVIGFSVVEFEC